MWGFVTEEALQKMLDDNDFPSSVLVMAQPMAENLINRILQMDDESGVRLEPLAGKLLTVEIRGLPKFFLLLGNERVRLLWGTEQQSNATIRAVLPEAVHLMFSSANRPFQPEENCEIVGDPDTVQLVSKFIVSFQPDWEEQLSRVMGDTLARKVGKFLQTVAVWSQDLGNSATGNIAEYLQQERLVLATRPRLERFLAGVQHLQQETGGLELRLQAFDLQTQKD